MFFIPIIKINLIASLQVFGMISGLSRDLLETPHSASTRLINCQKYAQDGKPRARKLITMLGNFRALCVSYQEGDKPVTEKTSRTDDDGVDMSNFDSAL